MHRATAAACLLLAATLGGAHAQRAQDASAPSELAFFLDVPGGVVAGPVVGGDSAYLLASTPEGDLSLVRLDLLTAKLHALAKLPWAGMTRLAADEEGAFVVSGNDVHAVAPDGSLLWRVALESPARVGAAGDVGTSYECAAPALARPYLTLACVVDGGGRERDGMVFRLAAETGATAWRWVHPPAGIAAPSQAPRPDLDDLPSAARPDASACGCAAIGVADAGPIVIAYFTTSTQYYAYAEQGGGGTGIDFTWSLWGLEAGTGGVRWSDEPPPGAQVANENVSTPTARRLFALSPPLLLPGATAARVDDLIGFAPDGTRVWTLALPRDDSGLGTFEASRVAPWRDGLLVDAQGDVHAVDGRGIVVRAFAPEAGDLLAFAAWGDDILLAMERGSNETLLELRTPEGALVDAWTTAGSVRALLPTPHGMLTLTRSAEGDVLRAFGASPAAIRLEPRIDVEPGATLVRVDLADARPAPHGRPTLFRADWGDGSTTDWTPASVLAHEYPALGAYVARFSARNAAGEGATLALPITLEPAPAPVETAQEEAAEPERGGVGLALALALALALGLVALAAILVAWRRRGEPDEPRPGALFLGKYEVERELGAGAFGIAWLATHRALGRRVVIKQLRREYSLAGDAAARFRREAKILAALDHPNVTRIHDVEEVARSWYIVMEYVDGGSLEERRLPIPPAAAAHVMQQVLEGLAYIHAKGIVHRDLKPANILVASDGVAKLADFGVARGRDLEATMRTLAGSPGTPIFMAPEQLEGAAGDARSDLFAAGATAFRLLTGEHWFGAPPRDAVELRRLVLRGEATAPAWMGPALGGWLLKALRKDPEERYQTADEMRRALMAALASGVPAPPPRPLGETVASV